MATLLLGMVAIPVNNAEAERPRVYCEFRWADNAELNVKGGNDFVDRKVRTREHERLVSMGPVPARVAADHGQHCQLNHIENTLIDTKIEKASYRLDDQGRIPNCADFNAIVECRGSRFIDTDVDRDPITSPTHPATVNERFLYHIVNKHSGKCLVVKMASTSNGADVIQWTCHDQPNTLWDIRTVENGAGVYYLSAQVSGKCAVVRNASKQEGADIIQWTCHNQPNTQWELNEVNNSGYFHILSRNSDNCLSVRNRSTSNGGDVIQESCTPQDSRLWKIRLREVPSLF